MKFTVDVYPSEISIRSDYTSAAFAAGLDANWRRVIRVYYRGDTIIEEEVSLTLPYAVKRFMALLDEDIAAWAAISQTTPRLTSRGLDLSKDPSVKVGTSSLQFLRLSEGVQVWLQVKGSSSKNWVIDYYPHAKGASEAQGRVFNKNYLVRKTRESLKTEAFSRLTRLRMAKKHLAKQFEAMLSEPS